MPECCLMYRETIVNGDINGEHVRVEWCSVCGALKVIDEEHADEGQSGEAFKVPTLYKEACCEPNA